MIEDCATVKVELGMRHTSIVSVVDNIFRVILHSIFRKNWCRVQEEDFD